MIFGLAKLGSLTICAAALIGVSTAGAATFKVDCDKNGGPSIQDRIDNNAGPGDTIEVSGACTEAVVLTKDGLRLVGVGGTLAPNGSGILGGASITAPVGASSTIAVLGRNVRIERLTIIGGGSSGVVISRGGSARVLNSVVYGAGRDGIIATRGTYVEVRRTEVKDNGRYGIFVRNSSSADIHLNDIHDNGDRNDAGVYISNSSSADIDGNDIHDNLGNGVLLTRASSVSFSSDPSVSPGNRSNDISNNGTVDDNGTPGDSSDDIFFGPESHAFPTPPIGWR
jgi:hypothetical protein